jgi:hypothetical protein
LGCAAETVTRTSLNRSLLDQESIKRVAVLSFENPPDDFQAGSHISKLFESGSQILDSGLQISDRIFFNLICNLQSAFLSEIYNPHSPSSIRNPQSKNRISISHSEFRIQAGLPITSLSIFFSPFM